MKNTQKKIAIVIMLLALTALAGPVLAAEAADVPPEIPIEAIKAIWAFAIATPMGFLMAFLTCLAGYASKTPPEDFRLDCFLYMALISIIIGAIFMYSGLPQQSAAIFVMTWLGNGFITWYVWKGTKIFAAIITKRFLPTPEGPPTTT